MQAAREDASAGRYQDALMGLQAALRKSPGLAQAGESEVGTVLRLLDGYAPPQVLAEIVRSAEQAAAQPAPAPEPASNVTQLRPDGAASPQADG